MDSLARLLALSPAELETRGLVHTPHEILQQPETWRRTFAKLVHLAPEIESFLVDSGVKGGAQTPLTVLLVGAGTSDYIGKSLSALLQNQWRCEVQAVPSTDLLTNMEEHVLAERSYLWISFSRSGDSSEGVAVLESALERYPNVRHLIVTCNERGQMASSFNDRPNVFKIVLDDAVNDRGLAMTSSFSNMVIVGQGLANLWHLEPYGHVLDELATTASRVLPATADVCERLVREGFSKACFLGTGPLKGAATESALKVLELTNGRRMSFSESFLGVRHGPLSAIDGDTLVVGFCSGEERKRAFEQDLIKEISDKRLTTKLVSVLPAQMSKLASPATEENTIFQGFQRPIADFYRPPVCVLFGQLLGLFASVREGLKPDSPSPEGAINRVVSHVTMH
jgi:D-galactosamine 6-phosphate deaminase/isomerase